MLNKPAKVSRKMVRRDPMSDLDDFQFYAIFRFSKADIPRLVRALQMPEKFIDPATGNKCSREEGIMILLYRLHFPSKLINLELLFGIHWTVCSKMFNVVLDFVYEKCKNKLKFEKQLIFRNLDVYADSIATKSQGALPRCIGFIDGTVHPISRPVKYQKSVWSGHKRVHGLKFQAVLLPDGMFGMLYGPVEARRHDVILLRESGLYNIFQNSPVLHDYFIFGDMGYVNSKWLLTPVKGILLDGQQAKWNKLCRTARITVEWSFGNLQQKWAHLMFKPAMQVFLVPTAKMYMVAAFLCNVHNCIYPNQTSQYFACQPPILEQYLSFVGIDD
jgi:hypothetical protein